MHVCTSLVPGNKANRSKSPHSPGGRVRCSCRSDRRGLFIPPERSKKSSGAARSHPNRCASRDTRPRINLWECRRNDRRAHPPDGRPLLPQMAVKRELRYRSRAGISRTIGTLSLTIGRSAESLYRFRLSWRGLLLVPARHPLEEWCLFLDDVRLVRDDFCWLLLCTICHRPLVSAVTLRPRYVSWADGYSSFPSTRATPSKTSRRTIAGRSSGRCAEPVGLSPKADKHLARRAGGRES